MNYNVDWQHMSEEKKHALIQALNDGLLFLLCRKLRLDYVAIKNRSRDLKNEKKTVTNK